MGDGRCRFKSRFSSGNRVMASKPFTVKSLYINNNYAKKRGIGKKLLLAVRTIMQDEYVNLVANDFNGAAMASNKW